MPITDTWGSWSSTAANNSPAGTAVPEIDDELRNVKAQLILNTVTLTGNQTVAGIKTFSSIPVLPGTDCASDDQAARKAYVDAQITSATSKYVQQGSYYTSSYVSTAATIPIDNTKPQISEGAELFNYEYTPVSTANKLDISIVFNGSVSVTGNSLTIALFEGTGTDAIAVAGHTPAAANQLFNIYMPVVQDISATTATTYSVRAGVNLSGNVVMNGSTIALWDGLYKSSITIKEYTPIS